MLGQTSRASGCPTGACARALRQWRGRGSRGKSSRCGSSCRCPPGGNDDPLPQGGRWWGTPEWCAARCTGHRRRTRRTAAQVAAKFGGTWEAYGQGRVLVGAGQATVNGVTRTFTAGATGGYYLINLTAAQLAPHYHGRGTQNIVGTFSGRLAKY